MKCNKCGEEFGKGETCQNCGADKVSALGKFTGYTTPKPRSIKKAIATPSPSTSTSSPQVELVSSQVCWKCGEIIPLGNFCPACGKELFRICPNCKTKYSSQYHICSNCGTDHRKYEKEQELERVRQKKREEEQKEEERRASLRASKIKQYKSYEVFASVIGAQIQLSWVSDIQRKELSPLLRELRAEIRKDKYNTIDWDTDLTKIERAKTKLSSNQTLESIQKELTRRQEQERIERENKERIERENKERIEREKERQRREREERIKAKSMAEDARERMEKHVSTHGNDSNAYEVCLIIFVGLFIALVLSFFIIIISWMSFSDSFEVALGAVGIPLAIWLVIIDKKAKKKHKNTEHFYLWREYPSVIDDIDITEINGEHASISFSNTAQYLPQQASIRVKRGECFTIKSGSSSINEITIYDDYGIIDFHHSGTLKNLETTTKGTLSPNEDISIWRGRAFDIIFKAANDVLLSRVDVVFDSIAESGGEMSTERGRESKLQ